MDEIFQSNLLRGEAMLCPCCKRFAKVYKRRLHSAVIQQLIKLYQLNGANVFVHASKLIPEKQTGAGDFTKAKYWGLIEQSTNKNPKLKTNGFWRLTKLGVGFIENWQVIPKFLWIFDDKIIKVSDESVNISQIYNNFDYRELI